ncbi:PREDICTED: agamous-like MADS-box protein AGL75 [Tarenaya hassleriana]|uniref:agamous-like MADS-box protein AGL75 n=1 Tax=Tarenaya hassleriana TaxID=28532 RepID=UPI00053C96CD|nr:PREDICTED: agamous-like MADS-box protein AGL75 [Tarenaya hassleriana]
MTRSSVSSPPSSNDQRKKSSFQRRQLTVMKKAEELSTLCGTQVAVICYGKDGELQTWPRDLSKVRELAVNYMKQNDTKKRKKSLNLSELRGKAEKGCLPKTKSEKGFELNTQKLHALSAEKLSELGDNLGREMKTLQERLRFLGTQKQKKNAEENQSRNLCRDQENQEPAIPSGLQGNHQAFMLSDAPFDYLSETWLSNSEFLGTEISGQIGNNG